MLNKISRFLWLLFFPLDDKEDIFYRHHYIIQPCYRQTRAAYTPCIYINTWIYARVTVICIRVRSTADLNTYYIQTRSIRINTSIYVLCGVHIIISLSAAAAAAAAACNCLCRRRRRRCILPAAVYLLLPLQCPLARCTCIHYIYIYVLDNQSDMNGIYNAAARVAEELEIMCM